MPPPPRLSTHSLSSASASCSSSCNNSKSYNVVYFRNYSILRRYYLSLIVQYSQKDLRAEAIQFFFNLPLILQPCRNMYCHWRNTSLFPLYPINRAIMGHWVFPMSMFYQPFNSGSPCILAMLPVLVFPTFSFLTMAIVWVFSASDKGPSYTCFSVS